MAKPKKPPLPPKAPKGGGPGPGPTPAAARVVLGGPGGGGLPRPKPVGPNWAVGGGLMLFVGGVYYYTMQAVKGAEPADVQVEKEVARILEQELQEELASAAAGAGAGAAAAGGKGWRGYLPGWLGGK